MSHQADVLVDPDVPGLEALGTRVPAAVDCVVVRGEQVPWGEVELVEKEGKEEEEQEQEEQEEEGHMEVEEEVSSLTMATL